MEKETKLYLLLGLYVGALYAANLLGGKLMPFGFGERGLTVAIIMFPFLFLITDIVGEVYGKKKAKMFVNVGLISLCVLLLWQLFAVSVPAAYPSEWFKMYTSSYHTVFGMSITFTIASILAFFSGQYVDVLTYHFFKRKHKGKYMWIRNNISTIFGQFVDTNLWMFIAFLPRLIDGSLTVFVMFTAMIVPYWLAKVIIAALDTPLAYLGVRWLKK